MLKNCILPVHYNSFLNKTCGEIICQNESSFIIICKICNIKIFQFNEFVEHFLLIHWSDIREANSIILCQTAEKNKNVLCEQNEQSIKTKYGAEFQENVYEEYNLDEPASLVTVKIERNHQPNERHQQAEDENSFYDSDYKEEDEESSDMNEPLAILKNHLKKESPYKCTICKRSFAKKSYLDMHKLKHARLKFHCIECKRSFANESLLKLHHQRKHEELEYRCNECKRSFAKESLLKQHQYKHTGYPCEQCGKYFKQRSSLSYHMDTHRDEKKFICDFEKCGKAFMNKRRLNAHKTVHSLKFVCEICGSRQSNKHSLIDHIRTHTGEKPYVCTLCNHRFTSRNLLCEHKACHETERKHICDVCGKSFNRQKALYHHKHLHLAIKKFVCKICGLAYAQAAGLSAHMRKHKDVLSKA